MTITASEAVKVQDTCDSSWGRNECPNKAEFLLRHTTSRMYAIMCGPHKDGFFESISPEQRNAVETHPYSLELNEQYAREAQNK